MQRHHVHFHHLDEAPEPGPLRRDHCVLRTVLGLVLCSILLTLLVISVGGQYFSQNLTRESTGRWARGEFFRFASTGLHMGGHAQSLVPRRALRAGGKV